MKKYANLESPKHSKLLFAACFVVYSASYIGRINYSAALVAIVSEGLFTKSQAGIIGSVFFIFYGACQVLWGYLGDKVSPFKMIITGTLFAAIFNFAFSYCESYLTMAVIWGLNGISHSMLWSPILRILSNVINKDLRAKSCLNLSLSLPLGTILAYLISSLIIKYFGWKYVFSAASFILIAAMGFFILVLLIIRPHLTLTASPSPNVKAQSFGDVHRKKLLTLLISSGLIFAILPTALHGVIKEGITTWVPTMVSETYGTSASFSIFLMIFLPIFNASGAYLIYPIYNSIMKKNEITTAAFCMLFAVIPITALLLMDKTAPIISVILMAMVTTATHAFNYMLITLVPVKFALFGKTATVTGIMNSSAYAGCAASTYGFGLIAEKLGWQMIVYIWLCLSFITFIICISLARRWRIFNKSMEDCFERI